MTTLQYLHVQYNTYIIAYIYILLLFALFLYFYSNVLFLLYFSLVLILYLSYKEYTYKVNTVQYLHVLVFSYYLVYM